MKIQPTNYTYQNTTNFKSTYPVVHWVCEANGSYAPIANLDLAKKLQDDELILYALLNKYKYVQDDATLTGEEKDKEKQSIKSEIDKLTQQLNKEENESSEVLSQGENSALNQSENNGLDLVPSNN